MQILIEATDKGNTHSSRESSSRVRACVFMCLCVATIANSQQSPLIDSNSLLALAERKIEAHVERQRRFACEALISREFYQGSVGPNTATMDDSRERMLLLWSRDRLHVEVGYFDGRQLFSWPGDGSFRFESLDEMVGGGASSTGDFGSFAASFLADSDPKSILFRGLEDSPGGQVAEYSYDVPVDRSHYAIKLIRRLEFSAYHGSMFVNVATGELQRVLIKVPNPPPKSGFVRATVDTSYVQGVAPGAGLIPSVSTLTLRLSAGNQIINRTEYRGCRIFTSESNINFETLSSLPSKNPEETQSAASVPPGLEVQARLASPIDSRTAFAGDLFETRVVDSVKHGKQTILAKGALLRGRIVKLEQQYYPRVGVCVGFDNIFTRTP